MHVYVRCINKFVDRSEETIIEHKGKGLDNDGSQSVLINYNLKIYISQ